jgi:hypothetical protein
MARLDLGRDHLGDGYVSAGALAGGSIPGNTSPEITQLSAQIRKLSAYPPNPDRDDFLYRLGVQVHNMGG